VLTTTRRLAVIALSALILATLAGPVAADETPSPSPSPTAPPPSSGFDEATQIQAGIDLVTLTNRQRTRRGLVALRADPDLMAIARDRAQVMAANDVMSHTEPNGQKVFDRLFDAGISFAAAGEIIAWNTYPTEPLSVAESIHAWLYSPSHRAIMLSTGYNYVGYGAAESASGKHYYAGVFVSERDETGAWAHFRKPYSRVVSSTRSRVYVSWIGSDTRLQVRTAGLRYFEVQRRWAGGEWRTWGTTTATHLSVSWARGGTYEIRVRARDRNGNWGGWRTIRVTL
jgi:uncharacterized protein YkwD